MQINDIEGVIRAVMEKSIPAAAAAELLGVSRRTIWRKLMRYRAHGAAGLLHGLRGRPSNRAKPKHVRERVIWLYRQLTTAMSVSAFTGSIVRESGIEVSRETVRQWLIEAGMWPMAVREGNPPGDISHPAMR